MTKQEAANFLGVSTRAIERYTTANKLHVTYRQRPNGGQEAIYDHAEVVKLKEGRQQGVLDKSAVEPNGLRPDDTLTRTDNASVTRLAPNALAVIERLATALENPPRPPTTPTETISLAEKLTLSLANASVLSGLSAGWLRKAIKAGQLRAAKRGRGWNIKRVDLEAYVRKL